MKTKTKTLLAVAILSVIAFAGNSFAQTPTPTATPDPNAGTYRDKTLSPSQRIQLANAVLSSGTDEFSIEQAANYMFRARPVLPMVTLYPAFADSVIADPSLGGKLGDTHLMAGAILWKADTITTLDDRIAYLADKLELPAYSENQVFIVKARYASLVARKAQAKLDAGDYNGAIATVTSVLGFGGNPSEISVMFAAKRALVAPDAMSWAKLIYVMKDYPHTNDGINAVTSVYRAQSGNMVDANKFVQYQKDGVGDNPLANVPLPKVTFVGNSDKAKALNKAIAGDTRGAIDIARNSFASAVAGAPLNIATSFYAQWIRNGNGNTVESNAFADAQVKGEPFTVSFFK